MSITETFFLCDEIHEKVFVSVVIRFRYASREGLCEVAWLL